MSVPEAIQSEVKRNCIMGCARKGNHRQKYYHSEDQNMRCGSDAHLITYRLHKKLCSNRIIFLCFRVPRVGSIVLPNE